MCSRLLKPESKEHGWPYRFFERGFDGLLHVYEAGLKVVLRHRFVTLMVMLGTVALTGYLYAVIPKGFFPQQETGLIIGLSEAAQDISFQAMAERQQASRLHCAETPEPAPSVDEVIARLRANLAKFPGIALYMQAAQDITIGGRLSKTQYQYTLDDADPGELNHWAALFLDRIRAIPGVMDVTTDQLNAGPMLDIMAALLGAGKKCRICVSMTLKNSVRLFARSSIGINILAIASRLSSTSSRVARFSAAPSATLSSPPSRPARARELLRSIAQ